MQERAGLAKVVPQAGGRRLLGSFRAGADAGTCADSGAAARPLPPTHPEMPRLLQGELLSPLSFKDPALQLQEWKKGAFSLSRMGEHKSGHSIENFPMN